jgi:hypothetical protein
VTTWRIERAGSLLGLIILASIAWYGRSDRVVVDGALYLVISSCLCLVSVLLAAITEARRRQGVTDTSKWARNAKAYVILLLAWQLAILGFLNMWAVDRSHGSLVFGLSYSSAIVFIICTYLIIGFTDKPKQEGGAKPLNYFGVPRSRTLLFYAFCYLIGPLFFAGVWIFFTRKPIPAPFQPPQLCLLLVSLLAVFSTGMVFQRYRSAVPDKVLAARVLSVAVCVLGAAAAIHVIFGYSTYLCVLSSIVLGCSASSFYWLSLAREGASPVPEDGATGKSPAASLISNV